MRNHIQFQSVETYNADEYGCGRHLTALGGCCDNGDEYGLGEWTWQATVEVTNTEGNSKSYTVAFQPEDRNDRMKAYSGYEVTEASLFGYEADQSNALYEFVDYDDEVVERIYQEAAQAAREHFRELEVKLSSGEIEVIRERH